MADKIIVDVSSDRRLIRQMWETNGIARAIEVLPAADSANAKLPGMVLARALIEKEVADARATLSQDVFRAAAKGGQDVSVCKSIHIAPNGGRIYLEIETYDLADLAEEG